jgi:hypothetical protein
LHNSSHIHQRQSLSIAGILLISAEYYASFAYSALGEFIKAVSVKNEATDTDTSCVTVIELT